MRQLLREAGGPDFATSSITVICNSGTCRNAWDAAPGRPLRSLESRIMQKIYRFGVMVDIVVQGILPVLPGKRDKVYRHPCAGAVRTGIQIMTAPVLAGARPDD